MPLSARSGTCPGNGIPLCGFHHRRVHDPRYTHKFLDTGEVRFRWVRRMSLDDSAGTLHGPVCPEGAAA